MVNIGSPLVPSAVDTSVSPFINLEMKHFSVQFLYDRPHRVAANRWVLLLMWLAREGTLLLSGISALCVIYFSQLPWITRWNCQQVLLFQMWDSEKAPALEYGADNQKAPFNLEQLDNSDNFKSTHWIEWTWIKDLIETTTAISFLLKSIIDIRTEVIYW